MKDPVCIYPSFPLPELPVFSSVPWWLCCAAVCISWAPRPSSSLLLPPSSVPMLCPLPIAGQFLGMVGAMCRAELLYPVGRAAGSRVSLCKPRVHPGVVLSCLEGMEKAGSGTACRLALYSKDAEKEIKALIPESWCDYFVYWSFSQQLLVVVSYLLKGHHHPDRTKRWNKL